MPIKAVIEKIRIGLSTVRQGKPKRLFIILVVIFVLYGLLIVMLKIKQFQEERRPALLPSPTPTPIEEIFIPSNYATDSAVLGIEGELGELEKELLETDLYETGLNPPVLDMEVEFKEK